MTKYVIIRKWDCVVTEYAVVESDLSQEELQVREDGPRAEEGELTDKEQEAWDERTWALTWSSKGFEAHDSNEYDSKVFNYDDWVAKNPEVEVEVVSGSVAVSRLTPQDLN